MEIQDLNPAVPVYLERVGFRGIKRRLALDTPEGLMVLDAEIDLYIDVDRGRRGAHLSRNVEALIDVFPKTRPRSIEKYLDMAAKALLERHEYAMRAVVAASTTYYVEVSYNGISGVEPVNARVEVSRWRSGFKIWSVEVTVYGMTVCPSAQSTIAELIGAEANVAPSHSQKVMLRGRVATKGGFIRIEDVAKTLFSAFSAPAFTLLKRPQEAKLIMSAFSNPKLVEDVVRDAIYGLSRLKGLEGDDIVEVEAVSLESIHPQNVYSYRRGLVREILEEAGGSK